MAATKSFITSLVAGARLVAHWQDDAELKDGLQALPDALRVAAAADWSSALDVLAPARSGSGGSSSASFLDTAPHATQNS